MLQGGLEATQSRLKTWLWIHVAYRLARLLARLGIMKSFNAWRLIYWLSPGLAGLIAFTDVAASPVKTFIWWWPGLAKVSDGLDTLLTDVSDVIERSPAPGGLDTYWVEIDRLSALVGDQNGVNENTVGESISQRNILERYTAKGDRYHDWKKGRGKSVLQELLVQACPVSQMPVTIVRVMVNGDVVMKTIRRWH